MNNRGDIPVTILVIGVFAICGLAILSFAISNNKHSGFSLDVGLFESIDADMEKFCFYKNKGLSYEEIVERLNYFTSETDKFSLVSEGGRLLLKLGRVSGGVSVDYSVVLDGDECGF